jgi:GH25 family lysozyme M1 (1,4-beta-N-acetylmuramidase)
MLKGVDTSYARENFNWEKAVADGIAFMMTKATEGISIVDGYASELIAGARAAGLVACGLYHFFHANDSVSTQVTAYMKVYNTLKPTMPPILDLEEASVNGVSYPAVADAALEWLVDVEAITGKIPVLYIDENMYGLLKIGSDQRFAKYTRWIAAYSKNAPTIPWTFWQYTASGEEASDTDYFNGSAADLDAFLN